MLLYFVLSKSVRRRLPGLSPLTLALPASGLVGLFGYSTMTMAVPALAALGLLALSGGVRGQPIDGAPRE